MESTKVNSKSFLDSLTLTVYCSYYLDSEFIEKKEVCGVISQLGYYWEMKSGENSVSEIAKNRMESFTQKSKRILDIILEE